MKNYKLQLSEGFKDVFGKEMLVMKEIGTRISNVFTSFGYETIKTPSIEYIDVYSENGLQKPDLYSLINRQGEVLALCNDMTSSIARFVASSKPFVHCPKKYSYLASTFRYPRQYQGKTHEFTQGGIELIGCSGVECDVEVIYLAYKSLKACGIDNFTIHLGSSEFLHVLLDDFDVKKDTKKLIYEAIENKNFVELQNIIKRYLPIEQADFIFRLVTRGGRLNYVDNLIENLRYKKSSKVLKYLKDLFLKLKSLHVEQVLFDFSIYSYAKYYTGVIFSVYIDNLSKAIIQGGRCDNLYKSFGIDTFDIGFGLDVDSLTDYILENDLIHINQSRYLSYSSDGSYINAFIGNEKFREKNVVVSHCFYTNLNEVIKYAKDNGFDRIIEYSNNSFRLLEVE